MEDRKSHRLESAASHRRTGVLRGILCAAFFISLPALAIDSSECGTPAQITARMKAEGQRSFAMADEVRRKNDLNSLYGMA